MAQAEQGAEDRKLVRAVLAGERGAPERFVRRAADTIWASCRRLTADEAMARAAFTAVLAAVQANKFSCLEAFDGRGRLDTFLALVVRDVLGRDAVRLAAADAGKGWRSFEALFGADLHRLVLRRLPGARWAEIRQDAYQEICAGLAADGCRRLAAYEGRGSPAGFVLHMADRLLVDFIRSFRPRRRLPAAVAKLAPPDQELFRLIWWQGMTAQSAGLALGKSSSELAQALTRVHHAVPADYQPGDRQVRLSDVPEPQTDASPEALLLAQEEDGALAGAARALRDLAMGLPEGEQLYLRILLSGADNLSPREMARLMQRPVEEVYRLRQWVLKILKESLAGHDAIKNWLASV